VKQSEPELQEAQPCEGMATHMSDGSSSEKAPAAGSVRPEPEVCHPEPLHHDEGSCSSGPPPMVGDDSSSSEAAPRVPWAPRKPNEDDSSSSTSTSSSWETLKDRAFLASWQQHSAAHADHMHDRASFATMIRMTQDVEAAWTAHKNTRDAEIASNRRRRRTSKQDAEKNMKRQAAKGESSSSSTHVPATTGLESSLLGLNLMADNMSSGSAASTAERPVSTPATFKSPPPGSQYNRPGQKPGRVQGEMRQRVTVETLKDAFNWPMHFFDTLTAHFGEGVLEELAEEMSSLTMSTAFSGIDTPGIGLHMIQECLNNVLQKRPGYSEHGPFTNMWACESFGPSQRELKTAPNGPKCVFTDVEDFWQDDFKGALKRARTTGADVSYEIFKRAVLTGRSVQPKATCIVHKGKKCTAQRAKLHVAGTICIDFSKFGTRKKLTGKSLGPFMAWIAMRRLLQEDTIWHENVPDFDPEILEELLGDIYRVESTIQNSVDYGWPAQRERRWTFLSHRGCVGNPAMPVIAWGPLFHRHVTATWQVFFCAPQHEIDAELEWARSRAASGTEPEEKLDDPRAAYRGAHFNALTGTEKWRAITYGIKWPKCCYSLGQNPGEGGLPVRSWEDVLQTLIMHCGLQYSWFHERWMVPNELLLTQGVPAYMELSPLPGVPMCSFNIYMPGRQRRDISGQAGNAMNTNVAGVLAAYSLLCVKKVIITEDELMAKMAKMTTAEAAEAASSSSQVGPSALVYQEHSVDKLKPVNRSSMNSSTGHVCWHHIKAMLFGYARDTFSSDNAAFI